MARGPKKHLKRLVAPKSWMLDKLGGNFAPRPSQGPHKLRESIPLAILLRNRLKYALNYREVFVILKDKRGLVLVDGKPRSDPKYPVGIMDVITIKSTGEHFRLQYDIKGRFQLQRISDDEAKFKLCSVKKRLMGDNGVPYIVTRDGRTIRYPHPEIKADDTIKLDLATGEILEHIKFEDGNLALVTGGKNQGRVGVVTHKETHEGAIDIVHIRDAKGHTFATRIVNLYVIGKGKEPLITLPKGEGIKLNIVEEQNVFYAKKQHH